MRAGLKTALRHMYEVRDALPPLVFSREMVSFAEGDIALGVVIQQLSETLERLVGEGKSKSQKGRPPGSREVAQSAARYLVRYIRKHAPEARRAKRKEFIFDTVRKLGITCPDLDNDPSAFNAWFREVEAIEPTPAD
jgi:hypothetical protein